MANTDVVRDKVTLCNSRSKCANVLLNKEAEITLLHLTLNITIVIVYN